MPGLFEVRYAFPSSDNAKLLGKPDCGCYYVSILGEVVPRAFETCREAFDYGRGLGRDPSFWSMRP